MDDELAAHIEAHMNEHDRWVRRVCRVGFAAAGKCPCPRTSGPMHWSMYDETRFAWGPEAEAREADCVAFERGAFVL